MAKVDISPMVNIFYDFFTSICQEDLNRLLSNYPSKRSLEVDYLDLERFDPELADRLVKDPDTVIEAAEEALRGMNLRVAAGKKFEPHVRFTNMATNETLIENIGSKSINEMVFFRGVLTRRAEVMHRAKEAVYRCQLCEAEMRVIVDKNFNPPKKCDSCKKLALVQDEEESTFTDIQRCEIQELLERVRGGAPASRVELYMEDDLVNRVSPGDNVEVVGTLRLRPPLKTKSKQELIYGRFIEVNSIKSMKMDFEEVEITKEDERQIRELSDRPNIREMIRDSVAPFIYGHNEVKDAIVLQLFGGRGGKMLQGDAPVRDDIHILLIGDPGIAKSRFLHSVSEIAPKSIYVSGKSVSSAGLTVAAEKDELGEGGWTLKAGALVLASGGTAQVDEFDKIEEEDRSALHEVMETQQISVAKAGIVAKFKTKAAILAAANPKYGRFDQTKSLSEQFDIPPTLLSRFDLIFPIVDVLDEEKDSRLAKHILSTHMANDGTPMEEKEILDKDILRKYISYSRRNCFPQLTTSASDKIREFYVDLRGKSKDAGSVAITPRYLEGLVRLAEASAKINLRTTVEADDAQIAIDLFNYVMKKIMTDRETGAFDVDVVTTGRTRTDREKMQRSDTVMEIIREQLREKDTADVEEVIQEAEKYGLDDKVARKILNELLRKGEIYEKEHGHVRIVGER
jgi:replicative DNA helicase Mcm